MKHILVIQEYGIGNAILCTPLVRTLARTHRVDLVLNSKRVTPFLLQGLFDPCHVRGRVLKDIVPPNQEYDLVLYCHPPGSIRPRPGQAKHALVIPADPFKKSEKYAFRFSEHEVTACLKLAGGLADPPFEKALHCVQVDPCRFASQSQKQISLGIGYLKDHPFWEKKHWGNDNFVQLVDRLSEHPLVGCLILVGDGRDKQKDGNVIAARCSARNMAGTGLSTILSVIMGSDMYIGNDTGLMHVAAAYGLITLGIFQEGVSNPVKNKPWCKDSVSLIGPSVEEVVRSVLPYIERL